MQTTHSVDEVEDLAELSELFEGQVMGHRHQTFSG